MEEQRGLLDALQALVRGTRRFAQAEKAGELIALPTGDGMALVFFADPIAAALFALPATGVAVAPARLRKTEVTALGPLAVHRAALGRGLGAAAVGAGVDAAVEAAAALGTALAERAKVAISTAQIVFALAERRALAGRATVAR